MWLSIIPPLDPRYETSKPKWAHLKRSLPRGPISLPHHDQPCSPFSNALLPPADLPTDALPPKAEIYAKIFLGNQKKSELETKKIQSGLDVRPLQTDSLGTALHPPFLYFPSGLITNL